MSCEGSLEKGMGYGSGDVGDWLCFLVIYWISIKTSEKWLPWEEFPCFHLAYRYESLSILMWPW
jgi:hypothetical protein